MELSNVQEFKVTYFFNDQHYIRRFIHENSFEEAIILIQSERDQYISFTDSREIYHELNTSNVRVIQIAKYFRGNKSN